ncbi:uncharacterized protein PV09_04944 [Verruconis gallopava]|uniref:Uncharacterized protein n=1 Tax=Verruconis gallopava TaxID=253628 RepID=A0A0D1XNI6_9PEZI|nr:uncharacterized protein PV09_04944 [Verruconis gallopava]KIW04136.1 hypothetical protein PV09_04944 [Verruconis gallopava]
MDGICRFGLIVRENTARDIESIKVGESTRSGSSRCPSGRRRLCVVQHPFLRPQRLSRPLLDQPLLRLSKLDLGSRYWQEPSHTHARAHTYTCCHIIHTQNTHTHTHIYIYIYVYVCIINIIGIYMEESRLFRPCMNRPRWGEKKIKNKNSSRE